MPGHRAALFAHVRIWADAIAAVCAPNHEFLAALVAHPPGRLDGRETIRTDHLVRVRMAAIGTIRRVRVDKLPAEPAGMLEARHAEVSLATYLASSSRPEMTPKVEVVKVSDARRDLLG